MTRDEAIAILELPREQAIEAILKLAEKAEQLDKAKQEPDPTTPSSMIPPYLKPGHGKRKKKPGRPAGHPPNNRIRPAKIDDIIPFDAADFILCQNQRRRADSCMEYVSPVFVAQLSGDRPKCRKKCCVACR